MPKNLNVKVNIDGRESDGYEISLPTGILESQALSILEKQLPGLYRNRLYANRLDNVIHYFEARPKLADRLMALLRQPGGISLLRHHLAAYRVAYSMNDPLTVTADHQEETQ